jgi:hypothetical protein
MIKIFAKTSRSLNKERQFFSPNVSAKVFSKSNIGPLKIENKIKSFSENSFLSISSSEVEVVLEAESWTRQIHFHWLFFLLLLRCPDGGFVKAAKVESLNLNPIL